MLWHVWLRSYTLKSWTDCPALEIIPLDGQPQSQKQQEKPLGKDPGTECKGSGITSDLRAEWTTPVIQNSWGVRASGASNAIFPMVFPGVLSCPLWTCLGPGLLTSETSGRKQIYKICSFSADNPLSQFLFSFINYFMPYVHTVRL